MGLELLFAALPYQSLALYTAVGFVVLGAGLFLVSQPREAIAEEWRIGGPAALLLALAAGSTGLVSIASIGRQIPTATARAGGSVSVARRRPQRRDRQAVHLRSVRAPS